ncbi:Transcriptional regulatory protein [Xenorhabdus poinarii G6]|uniref:Transcriptional regulatory protein n=1 Tax=Xenorhabdus poinarii G6 TaxID=1354304 RepID=A0A068R833_9GAMM|nr:LysR family transcriptional regulator [Xenorhabdus poinarii]CDG23091.1 Transcriptional regulatory protein [Xenorhabdus poinarii G6]
MSNRTLINNISDILVFVKVANVRSFTTAAQLLGISRSAVGKSINRLEEQLSSRLMYRTTRSINLSEEGVIFYEHALKIINEVEEIESTLNKRNKTPEGRFRVDLPVSFGRMHVIPILFDFLSKWPEVEAEVTFSDYYSDLVRDGIDLAIRIGGNDDSRLIRKVLAPHRLITCASPNYLKNRGVPETPDDLFDHETLVFLHQGMPVSWHYQINNQCHDYRLKSRMLFHNSEALRDAALAGFGLIQVGAFLVGEQIRKGELIPVLESFCREEKPICAVYPTRHHLSQKVRKFIELIDDKWKGKAIWE